MQKTIPNKWVKKNRSGIHGGGLFARRNISRGTRIIEYVGHKLTKAQSLRRTDELLAEAARTGDGAVYIFELNKRHDIDGSAPWNLARFINHSCDANCEPQIIRGRIWITALRDIPKGEELGYNYGYDADHWLEHVCLCGKPACIGHIAARDQWARLHQLKRHAAKG